MTITVGYFKRRPCSQKSLQNCLERNLLYMHGAAFTRREAFDGITEPITAAFLLATGGECLGQTDIVEVKGDRPGSNSREDQERTMLCLHLLQNSMAYINILMLQQVLSDPAWRNRLQAEDLRALTPLIYLHVHPYGWFDLDMNTRLPIELPAAA